MIKIKLMKIQPITLRIDPKQPAVSSNAEGPTKSAPQFGQNLAVELTSRPHSPQLMIAINQPSYRFTLVKS